jgi:squalene-hopene/tetraprenyl-beta-curcumene cyclase
VGGWSFQAGHERNPDIDSTAVVLSALATRDSTDRPELERAVALGTDWLLSMQNRDGGFAAFSHGKRAAPPGPLYLPPEPRRGLRIRDLPSRVERWLAEHGDPSTADVTGRVLHGLGSRLTWRDERVARAIAFLRRHQTASGAFWGRWAINYLPATSYILTGLRAVGVPTHDPMIERAVRWMLGCQNADGGFGETPRSYELAGWAGRGPSSIQVTGVVVWALVSAGAGNTDGVSRAVRYLLSRQSASGGWDDECCYGVIFPHRYYYRSDLFPTHFALEALRAYQSHIEPVMRPGY